LLVGANGNVAQSGEEGSIVGEDLRRDQDQYRIGKDVR
jgi:hypothetical protein